MKEAGLKLGQAGRRAGGQKGVSGTLSGVVLVNAFAVHK